MNKKTKIIRTTIAGSIVAGIGTYTIAQGVGMDAGTYEEESSTHEDAGKDFDLIITEAQQVNQDADNGETDEDNNEVREVTTRKVTLLTGDHGTIEWGTTEDDHGTAWFDYSTEGDVEFLRGINVEKPEDNIRESLVRAIHEEIETNGRVIYFNPGKMDDEDRGTIDYLNHERERRQVRFVVQKNGEIEFNESDWDAIPEVDEYTLPDLEAAADEMIYSYHNILITD